VRREVREPLAPRGVGSYVARMKMLTVLFATLLAIGRLSAQPSLDTAAQVEELKRLNSAVEALIASQALQQKRMDDLALQIEKLRQESARSESLEKFASREQITELTTRLKEVDEQRLADRKVILEEIKKLGKAAAAVPPRVDKPAVTAGHFEYVIQPGDSYSAIAAGVSKQLGAKITVAMIEKANPGVDPTRLKIGQTILIPEPAK
jgi:LysM repeat protein